MTREEVEKMCHELLQTQREYMESNLKKLLDSGAVNFEEIKNYRIPKQICVALLRISTDSLIFCNKKTQPKRYKERNKEVENYINMIF